MATVQCWTGAETKALRQAMRLSVRAFAAHLGVDARTVNKWEARGSTITLLPDTQALMDTALDRAPDDVKTRFTQTLDSAESPERVVGLGRIAGEVAPLRRCGFLKYGIVTVAFPALEFDELCHLGVAFDDARRYLDADVVGYFKRQMDSCIVNDGIHGPARVLPLVLGIVAAIERHVRQTKADVRRELLG
jgi:transcriptional regulator with XRE-family HTH domain